MKMCQHGGKHPSIPTFFSKLLKQTCTYKTYQAEINTIGSKTPTTVTEIIIIEIKNKSQ